MTWKVNKFEASGRTGPIRWMNIDMSVVCGWATRMMISIYTPRLMLTTHLRFIHVNLLSDKEAVFFDGFISVKGWLSLKFMNIKGVL